MASVTAQGPQAVSATQPDPARLACKPEFGETEQPLDVSRMYDVPSDCVAEPDQLATECLDRTHSLRFEGASG